MDDEDDLIGESDEEQDEGNNISNDPYRSKKRKTLHHLLANYIQEI